MADKRTRLSDMTKAGRKAEKPTVIGAIRDPQFVRDVLQGLGETATRGITGVLGAPVDITTMAMRPFGYSVPAEQVVGGSEYLGKQLERAGMLSGNRNQLSELLAGLVTPDPLDVAKLGAMAVPVVGRVARQAPRDEAMRIAQANAAKPISEGGLGLPPDNTAMDRARAIGFDFDLFHGTTGDIQRFDKNLLGESTGAESAQKAFFFARDPQSPPEHMLLKSPTNSETVQMLRDLGIPEDEITKLNEVSMKGHGAETASGYSALGGSRTYKEATRKAKAAEKSGNWPEYERQTEIAENAEIFRNQELQNLVSKYGETRDIMLENINNAIYSKQLPQAEAEALDSKIKQLMPYGWYNSYSIPQLQALKGEIAKIAEPKLANAALKSIDNFISTKANRQLAETYQEGSNVLPVAVSYKNPMIHDFGGSSYRDQTYSDLLDQAKKLGHDALILKNTYDPGAGPAKLIDVLAIANPSQIRSRFAAFDPARRYESDLLGAADPRLLGAIGLGTAGAIYKTNREKEKDRKREK